MIRKLLIIFLLLLSVFTYSQKQKILISGKVLDSIGNVKNANIINLNTNQGTFSFDNGRFKIYASEGDSLRISNIQYHSQKIIINKETITNKALIVQLKSNTYVLDAFELKKNNLIGKLAIDLKSVPTNNRRKLLKSNMDFSNVDFSLVDHRIDANIRAKAPKVNTVSNSYSGVNISSLIGGLLPGKKFKKSKSMDEKFDREKALRTKILAKLGESFFFEKLKIPQKKLNHFLDYCSPLNVAKMYKENKILELIETFQKESILYLKIIEKE